MPTTIPYDPGLVLGNVVNPNEIERLEKIAVAQQPVDDAQRELDSLILWKRSLDMTVTEMTNMGSSPEELKPLVGEIETIRKKMVETATKLGSAVITAEGEISTIRETKTKDDGNDGQDKIHAQIESPIDYNKSSIKQMPISSDSIQFDAQYFRHESEKDDAQAFSAAVASYVTSTVGGFLGSSEISSKMGGSAKTTAEHQATNHSLEGTLVITANCTLKAADIFAPFVLDPEKGIRAWNQLMPNNKIDVEDDKSIAKAIKDSTTGFQLLSGATYGASFVGMVHLLKDESTESSQSAASLASQMESSFKLGLLFESESGGFGLNSSFADEIKSLLSNSTISTHATMISMGIIPSIKSNELKSVVKSLAPDPKDVMDQLSQIQGATDGDVNNMYAQADKAKVGQSFMTLNNSYVKSVVSSVSDVDVAQNKVLDTNSLMVSFEDFVNKAIAGDCGVPINFFLKPITSRQLMMAWVNEFYPGQYNAQGLPVDKSSQGGTGTASNEPS